MNAYPSSSVTVQYQGNGAAKNLAAERCKMALVRGSGSHSACEVEHILRSRLRVASLIAAGGFAVFLIKNLLDQQHALGPCPVERGLHTIALLIEVALAGLLWTRWRLSVGQLRAVELAVFGTAAAFFSWGQYTWFHEGKILGCANPMEDPMAVYHLAAFSSATRWLILIVMYGTFIPNTWRRCALVTGTLALIPLVLTLLSIAGRPEIRPHLIAVLEDQAIMLGIAFTIALFGSYKLNELQQEAMEMRQLGQYRLKERLGAGGMGEVYLAEHLLLRRQCAVKMIRAEQAGNPATLSRFEREVQATATLTHWNTIEIYDYGHAEDGTFYYVMEYLPGMSLEDLVTQQGPLSPERAVHFLRQVCGPLREAHSIGLIHRDIKPSNVFATERGGVKDVAKLLDFGLVQSLDFGGLDARLTLQGTILGSPPYMSPEQAAGKTNLDGRTDIYSLGAVAYFLLTGQPPFLRDTAMQMLLAHAYEPVKPFSELRADVPADLQEVILRCLEKDPSKRYPDAASLEKALSACACAGQWTEDQAAESWQKKSMRSISTSIDLNAQPTVAAAPV